MKEIIDFYDNESEKVCELHDSIIPVKLYKIIDKYFNNGSCLDVGCGIGRDTNYLYEKYKNCIGIDASINMLEIAKSRYENIEFRIDSLPSLNTLTIFEKCDNILCSAVLMLFDSIIFDKSIKEMLNRLKDNGVLIICIRDGIPTDRIEIHNHSTSFVFRTVKNNNGRVLYYERMKEENRSIYWNCYVIKREYYGI